MVNEDVRSEAENIVNTIRLLSDHVFKVMKTVPCVETDNKEEPKTRDVCWSGSNFVTKPEE